MPKGKVYKNIEVITENEVITSNDIKRPIYGGFNKIVNCQSIKEIRDNVCNGTILNENEPKTIGIMKVNVDVGFYYKAIDQSKNYNIITFDIEDVYLSQDCKILGMDDKYYYIELKDEFRKVKVINSVIFEVA